MSEYIIDINNLSYKVKDINILNDISFHANKNNFIGIVGANGSGKTTMLKHLYNALIPMKKTGREIGRASCRERV